MRADSTLLTRLIMIMEDLDPDMRGEGSGSTDPEMCWSEHLVGWRVPVAAELYDVQPMKDPFRPSPGTVELSGGGVVGGAASELRAPEARVRGWESALISGLRLGEADGAAKDCLINRRCVHDDKPWALPLPIPYS